LIIAIIYLGTNLPKYVSRNLRYLRDTFPEREIVFISDSKKSLQKASIEGVDTWLAPHPEIYWKHLKEKLQHPMSFRDGFWFKTLARIFVLDLFLSENPNVSCLQVEADVFLFKNFPFRNFERFDADISFPMESSKMGIASLLFLKNSNASKTLVHMAIEAIEQDGQITDMSLLGRVAHSIQLNFSPLPTIKKSFAGALTGTTETELFCSEQLGSSGVFDGITLGQYLLGVDPRNSRGFLFLHKQQKTHAINAEMLNFKYECTDELEIFNNQESVSIYNLHNHSKDLRLYNEKSRDKLLKKRVKSAIHGEQKKFIPNSFLEAIWKSVRRRLQEFRKR
jgi:hypothetical protein